MGPTRSSCWRTSNRSTTDPTPRTTRPRRSPFTAHDSDNDTRQRHADDLVRRRPAHRGHSGASRGMPGDPPLPAASRPCRRGRSSDPTATMSPATTTMRRATMNRSTPRAIRTDHDRRSRGQSRCIVQPRRRRAADLRPQRRHVGATDAPLGRRPGDLRGCGQRADRLGRQRDGVHAYRER